MSEDLELLASEISLPALRKAAQMFGNGFSKDIAMRQRIQESQNGQIITLYEGPCLQYFPHLDGVIVNTGDKYLLNARVMFSKQREKEFLFYEHPQGAIWVRTINKQTSEKEFFLNGEFLYSGHAQAWRSCLGGVLIEKDKKIYFNGTQLLCEKKSCAWHAHPKGVALVKPKEVEIFSIQDGSCQKILRVLGDSKNSSEKFSAKYGYFSRSLAWRGFDRYSGLDSGCTVCTCKRNGEDIVSSRRDSDWEWYPHPDGVLEIDDGKPPQIYLNNCVLTAPLVLPNSLHPFIWKQWDHAPQGINCSDGKTIVYLSTTADKTFVYHTGEYLSWRSHEQGILLETKGKTSQEKIISLIVRKS